MEYTLITITTRALNINRDTIYKWMQGVNRPSPMNAEKLERLFNLPVTSFLYPDRSGNPWKLIKSLEAEQLKRLYESYCYNNNHSTGENNETPMPEVQEPHQR